MATELESLQGKYSNLKNTMGNSPTAFASSVGIPTSRDLSTDKQLSSVNKQIDDLRSTQVRNQWYGPSDAPAENTAPDDGILVSGIKAIQKPLNAIVGAAQYVLGKGTQPTLAGNVNAALKSGLTSGNVLQQEGVPRAVQIPLGFALDVMFDPVNWLTMGTDALIPRVGYGLIKGGLEDGGIRGALDAAGTGLVSNLEKKAATTMNLIPFVKKAANLAPALEEGGIKANSLSNIIRQGATKFSEVADNMGTKAIAGSEKYDSLVGKNVFDKLNVTPFGFKGGTIGNAAEDVIRGKTKVPGLGFLGTEVAPDTTRGDKIADFFKYSPKKAADVADQKDAVIKIAKDSGIILERNPNKVEFQTISEIPGGSEGIKTRIAQKLDETIQEADKVAEVSSPIRVTDNFDNAKALLESAGEDYNLKNLTQAYRQTPIGKTGVQWFDTALDRLKSTTVDDILHTRFGPGDVTGAVQNEADELVKTWNSYGAIKDLKPFEKLLDAHQTLISLFKSAKVPMNAASHIVANIGNFFMGTMMGLPMWKSEYLKSMAEANLLVKGRLGANGFKEMFFQDVNSLIDMADKNPTRFKQLTGMDASEIANKLKLEEKITNVIRPETTGDELLNILQKAADQASETDVQLGSLSNSENIANEAADFENSSKANKSIMKEKLGAYPTPSEQLSKMLKEAPVTRSEEFGSYTTGEITQNDRFEKIKSWIASEAGKQPYNPAYRIANTLVNSMPKWYEHIDQSFKIGTSNYLTKVGLTEAELVNISRTIPLTAEDILPPTYKGGEKLYRLTQLKASEVATEAFMNYAAMPDFVRVMRAIPIAGSPFLSFPYAMAIKTGKTAINNPALFNKIGFMINEMNAGRTPQEKAALEDKYNQYLKSPTVVKIFGMWNTDVKNLIPYFQMNMFNPSERKYSGTSLGSEIMKLSDKFPVMQDPVGSVIRDYFIQPWLLSGSGDISQGQFGEPIYPSYDEKGKPINVGLGTKGFYAGRALAESAVPGALSYLGLPAGIAGIDPSTTNLIPSYGFRNLANATQGRSSIGAITKEDAVRKTFRSLLGRTGIPAYTLDTTKSNPTKK